MATTEGRGVEMPSRLFAEITGYDRIQVDSRFRERRKLPRSPLPARAMVLRILGRTASKPAYARVRDISRLGVGILHCEPARDGEELFLRLPRQRNNAAWVSGIVVHCRLVERGLYRIGLRFRRFVGVRPAPDAPN